MPRSLYHGLRQGFSLLRAETHVALTRLRLEIPEGALVLDTGGPSVSLDDAFGSNRARRTVSLNSSRSRKPDVLCDLDTPWPIGSSAVDVVHSSYVLEHLYRPARFFEESHRCLKPNGILLLTTVFNHPKHGSPQDYFRFTDDALVRLASEVGFEARTIPLLSGPLQSSVATLSPFLLFPLARAVAIGVAKAGDRVLKRLLPFVEDNWCVGYVLVARKR